MCDCEELEFEDFQAMLSELSKRAEAPSASVPLQVPIPIVAHKRNR